MKKALAILGAVSIAVSSYAQGWVTFTAGTSAATRISTNSVVGGAATGLVAANAGTAATSYYYALFYSLSATTVGGSQTAAISGATGVYAFQDSNWTFGNYTNGGTAYLGPDYATNTASAGRLSSTVADGNNSGGTVVPSGSAQQFVVIGWSGNIGSTLAALEAWYADPTVAGWIGQSEVSGAITPGTGGLSTPPTLFGGAAPYLQGFTLGEVAVPEPGTLALAAIGGASLLLFRRKK